MNKLLFLTALVIVLYVQSAYAQSYGYWNDQYKALSITQKQNLRETFKAAAHKDLSWSMTAIHFKESLGSKYKFNINTATSIDVGAFMVNTKEYLRRNNLKNNKWNTARAMEALLDYNTNLQAAIEIFETCLKKSKQNYQLAFQYYNGWTSGSKASISYKNDIIIITQVLRRNL